MDPLKRLVAATASARSAQPSDALEFLLALATYERAVANGLGPELDAWNAATDLRDREGTSLGASATRALTPLDPEGPPESTLRAAIDLATLLPLLPAEERGEATERLEQLDARMSLEPEDFAPLSAWAASQLDELAGPSDPAWGLLVQVRGAETAAQAAAEAAPLRVELGALLDRAWARHEAGPPMLDRIAAWGTSLVDRLTELIDEVAARPLPAAAHGKDHTVEPDWEERFVDGGSEQLWLRTYGPDVVLVWVGQGAPERLIAHRGQEEVELPRLEAWESEDERLFRWPAELAPADVTALRPQG